MTKSISQVLNSKFYKSFINLLNEKKSAGHIAKILNYSYSFKHQYPYNIYKINIINNIIVANLTTLISCHPVDDTIAYNYKNMLYDILVDGNYIQSLSFMYDFDDLILNLSNCAFEELNISFDPNTTYSSTEIYYCILLGHGFIKN